MKSLLKAATVIYGLSIAVIPVFAQTWTPTKAPTNGWISVASSADGAKLVAAILLNFSGAGGFGGLLFTSTNSGVSWTSNNVPVTNWVSVASSADGTKLVAVADGSPGGAIYTTTNSGAMWKQATNAPRNFWTSIATSANGDKLAAAYAYGGVYTSTDSGVTWTSNYVSNAINDEPWVFVASSADGNKLAVAGYGGGIYTSTNAGLNWAQSDVPQANWEGIASSTDGVNLAAATQHQFLVKVSGYYTFTNGPGPIYTSTNSGLSWTTNNVPNQLWTSIASSADGTKLVAMSGGGNNNLDGPIYVSTNSGLSWTLDSVSNEWGFVTSSADGNTLFALLGSGIFSDGTVSIIDGPIYISQTTPAPKLNIALLSNNLALSWVIPSTNLVLQQSLDLSSWVDLTNKPVLSLTNLQNEVTLPPANGSGYYRLGTPGS